MYTEKMQFGNVVPTNCIHMAVLVDRKLVYIEMSIAASTYKRRAIFMRFTTNKSIS